MPDSYPDVRASLLRRGWVENTDASSVCFNLKWCLRTRAIDKPPLAKCQMVNHFRKTSCLTTKNGLAQCVLVLVMLVLHFQWGHADLLIGMQDSPIFQVALRRRPTHVLSALF